MKKLEITIFAVVIIILNIPILAGTYAQSMVLLPEKILVGQWWRILTHPFVHLSWYHLLIDAGAFFLLYAQIEEKRFARRFVYMIGSLVGSMFAAAIAMPALTSVGYCGLSGIAHGLMAVSSIEMIIGAKGDKARRNAGLISFGLLTVKSIYEAVTGNFFLGFLHPDLLGTPVLLSHMGGMLGGCAAYAIANTAQLKKQICKRSSMALQAA